jgi:hypothetical protein
MRSRYFPTMRESFDHPTIDGTRDAVTCERCGSPVSNPLSLVPTAGTRGADVYRCDRCEHLTYRWFKPRS